MTQIHRRVGSQLLVRSCLGLSFAQWKKWCSCCCCISEPGARALRRREANLPSRDFAATTAITTLPLHHPTTLHHAWNTTQSDVYHDISSALTIAPNRCDSDSPRAFAFARCSFQSLVSSTSQPHSARSNLPPRNPLPRRAVYGTTPATAATDDTLDPGPRGLACRHGDDQGTPKTIPLHR